MNRRTSLWVAIGFLGAGLSSNAGKAGVLFGNPSNYKQLVAGLHAGDTLQLEAGNYTQGLPVEALLGQPGLPIVIAGPATGAPAVFLGSSSRNTISITQSSYVTIRDLKLDGLDLEGDGVKAEERLATSPITSRWKG